MELLHLLQFAVPGFTVLILAEIAWMKWRGGVAYEGRDSAASLAMGLGNLVDGALIALLLYPLFGFLYQHRLVDWAAGTLVAFPLVLVVQDFCFYWSHRLSHEWRLWWAAHVTHHSSLHYNLTTALRQPWSGFLAMSWAPYALMPVLGIPIEAIALAHGVSLAYQFWIHTEAVGRLPRWFEALFNTPSHHRVHHATNPRYLDRNYAGILIVWDRLFGTFEPEAADDPPRYGIVRNLGSFNPLVIGFHEWVGIWRDLRAARTWRARCMALFGPPGWRADGTGATSDVIRARWRRRALPDPAE
ncbi:sterol desaturase family protein [Zavarzinia compransoris]|uniref:C-5 sterol desaturase n=1 Tax=Zavarzinia compransoris TaxID=1264899 RepID=A0A317E0J7_9PROT|nr:sterol desaturase family protein [Zavarzinia compransoris]PWR20578.1 C-5 sterol desaturase [Zavarzinia compransoris]TDP43776.1 sterol desaturase/sphingolipid hydroxylase (fatty acid hydroxylase superfamily) [Zavarzinia compransoris]